eukprot:GILI01001600.1.p1 GENE.GILI01001600.1~~GILI01001600.1.p1  ORF type:complete len:712 (-),score=197.16 GILI01001600.1:159-2294(-)
MQQFLRRASPLLLLLCIASSFLFTQAHGRAVSTSLRKSHHRTHHHSSGRSLTPFQLLARVGGRFAPFEAFDDSCGLFGVRIPEGTTLYHATDVPFPGKDIRDGSFFAFDKGYSLDVSVFRALASESTKVVMHSYKVKTPLNVFFFDSGVSSDAATSASTTAIHNPAREKDPWANDRADANKLCGLLKELNRKEKGNVLAYINVVSRSTVLQSAYEIVICDIDKAIKFEKTEEFPVRVAQELRYNADMIYQDNNPIADFAFYPAFFELPCPPVSDTDKEKVSRTLEDAAVKISHEFKDKKQVEAFKEFTDLSSFVADELRPVLLARALLPSMDSTLEKKVEKIVEKAAEGAAALSKYSGELRDVGESLTKFLDLLEKAHLNQHAKILADHLLLQQAQADSTPSILRMFADGYAGMHCSLGQSHSSNLLSNGNIKSGYLCTYLAFNLRKLMIQSPLRAVVAFAFPDQLSELDRVLTSVANNIIPPIPVVLHGFPVAGGDDTADLKFYGPPNLLERNVANYARLCLPLTNPARAGFEVQMDDIAKDKAEFTFNPSSTATSHKVTIVISRTLDDDFLGTMNLPRLSLQVDRSLPLADLYKSGGLLHSDTLLAEIRKLDLTADMSKEPITAEQFAESKQGYDSNMDKFASVSVKVQLATVGDLSQKKLSNMLVADLPEFDGSVVVEESHQLESEQDAGDWGEGYQYEDDQAWEEEQ